MTILWLPFPPSVNGMFENRKGGRRKSDKYNDWLADATENILQQKSTFKPHHGQVSIKLHLKAPDKRLRDADNLNKAVIDLLVTHGIIVADDSRYVRSITTEWVDTLAKPGCIVTIADL